MECSIQRGAIAKYIQAPAILIFFMKSGASVLALNRIYRLTRRIGCK